MSDLIRDMLLQIADNLTGNRMSFREFCKKYLPHHFVLPPSQFHFDLQDRLEAIAGSRGAQDVWAAPRGNAKSTTLSLAYPIYCICYDLERYIILAGDTYAQAVQFLGDIKLELEQNEMLKADFPHATGKGERWADHEIITKNRVMITAMGTRGKIRGRKFGPYRPTLIILDDPENDESVISPRQRERTLTWLIKGVMAAGTLGHTNIVIVGTVINADCLVQNLSANPGWFFKCYASVIQWPSRMDLWDEWEQVYYDDATDGKELAREFYLYHKAEMDEGAKVLWPEKEDLYTLMCLRCDQGHLAFESEKQNSPVNPAQCRFPSDWFNDIWFDDIPLPPPGEDSFVAFGACDPSLGKESKKGDYAPIVTVHWRQGERHLFVDCDMTRRPPSATIDATLAYHRKVTYQKFGYEINGFQVVLAGELQKKSDEQHLYIPLVLITHTKPKELRIEKLGVLLQSGALKFRRTSPGCKLLVKQLMMFPIGDHDDGPDALEMVVEMITQAASK